jgi:hypothetical protein
MSRTPEPITRDQEFYCAILAELRETRLQLTVIASGMSGESSDVICEQCGRSFRNERALRAHMRMHKE